MTSERTRTLVPGASNCSILVTRTRSHRGSFETQREIRVCFRPATIGPHASTSASALSPSLSSMLFSPPRAMNSTSSFCCACFGACCSLADKRKTSPPRTRATKRRTPSNHPLPSSSSYALKTNPLGLWPVKDQLVSVEIINISNVFVKLSVPFKFKIEMKNRPVQRVHRAAWSGGSEGLVQDVMTFESWTQTHPFGSRRPRFLDTLPSTMNLTVF